jgi:HSP20 family molecular chaperone IbpA
MTQLQHWAMDPFDIVWKNFFDTNAQYNTMQEKINYPVDIYETKNGLCFELAVVGLGSDDIDIQVEGDVLRISHNKKIEENEVVDYIQRGIARRSFDLAWKIASKFDLTQLEADMGKGLLVIHIPQSSERKARKIEIKRQEIISLKH